MFGSHYNSNDLLDSPDWKVYITHNHIYRLIVDNRYDDQIAFLKIKYILEHSHFGPLAINRRFDNNATALETAISHGNINVVQLLLKHGAVLPKDALVHATRSTVNALTQNQLIHFLIEKGAGKNPDINANALLKYFEIFQTNTTSSIDDISIFINTLDILSDLPMAWEFPDAAGATILQNVFYSQPSFIPMLLEKGAQIEQLLIGPLIALADKHFNETQIEYLQLARMKQARMGRMEPSEYQGLCLADLGVKTGISYKMRTEAAAVVKAQQEKVRQNVSSSKSALFGSSAANALFEKKLFTNKCFKKSTKPGYLYESNTVSLIPDEELILLGLKSEQWERVKEGMDNLVYIKDPTFTKEPSTTPAMNKESKETNNVEPAKASSSTSALFGSSALTSTSSSTSISVAPNQALSKAEAQALFEKKLFSHACFKKSTKPGYLYVADSYSVISDADLIKLGLKPGQWVRDKNGMDNYVYVKEISVGGMTISSNLPDEKQPVVEKAKDTLTTNLTPSNNLQEEKKPAVDKAKETPTKSLTPPNHWQDAKKHILNNNFELFVQSYQAWKASVSETWGASSSFFKSQELGVGKNDLLHWAYNNKQATWHLIDDGANPQIALNSASNTDDVEHAKALLARGADAAAALDFLVDRRKVGFYETRGQNEVYLQSVIAEKNKKAVQQTNRTPF